MAKRSVSKKQYMLLALAVSVIVVLFLVVSFFVLRHSLAQNNGPTTEPTQQTYTVVFENVDGSILSVKTYEEGAKVEIPEDPSYGPDVQYTYTFRSWDRAVELYVYSDAKYTALYDTSLNAYTITFVNYDGSEISRQTGYYGSEIEYVGATPRRPSDQQYDYTFSGWEGASETVIGDMTLTALYSGTLREYTVTFLREDGSFYQSAKVTYGESGESACTPPIKAPTERYVYVFDGWSSDLSKVTGDVTVCATYREEPRTYTVSFVDADGTPVSTQLYAYESMPSLPEMPAYREGLGYFAGWDKTVSAVKGDARYIAVYAAEQKSFSITVRYLFEDGSEAASPYSAYYPFGEKYTVSSPDLEYYKPDVSLVSGEAYGDAEYVVVYRLDYVMQKDENGYYVIDSVGLLSIVARDPSLWSNDYSLACDLSLEGVEWNGIGSGSVPFSGIFDGKGHTVSGVRMQPASATGLNFSVGFFNVVSGTVRNLKIEGSITVSSRERILLVGGIVGELTGTVSNCSFAGTVSAEGGSNSIRCDGLVGLVRGGSVSACLMYADVSGVSEGNCYLGGLAGGAVDASVADCSGMGTVSGSGTLAKDVAYRGGVCTVESNDLNAITVQSQ